ncbi:MAG: exonuclease SbcCD subunit D [Rothia sp. (in: high G+C Gram-positive bacteria)]|nr:exonuclease SbcCD subunit D [Rothia sp. (in: high G+C Gram-positive bacteria)]
MRILHTSDWHLGRTFHGLSLHQTMSALLDELVETVQQQEIDVVLISGDVYDQAQPRPETVRLFSSTLSKLVETGAQVVAISGNHDSAVRLGFAADLLAQSGVHLITSQTQVGIPVLLPLGTGQIAFYGIPYLEPRPVSAHWGTKASHEAVLAEAMARIEENRAENNPLAAIVLAHCFASGGTPSDSERDISVGGALAVPAQIFSAASYTALGHLHGRQRVTDTVRYSGSLLPYSFSEQNHIKGAWIIEVDDAGHIRVEEHRWRTTLTLKKMRGTFDEITSAEMTEQFGSAFVSITLTDAARPARALDRLKEHYDDVLELFFDPQGLTPAQEHSYRRTREAKSAMQVCASFYEHVRGRELTAQEKAHLQAVTDEARVEGQSA